jgi:hypothetical protein
LSMLVRLQWCARLVCRCVLGVVVMAALRLRRTTHIV